MKRVFLLISLTLTAASAADPKWTKCQSDNFQVLSGSGERRCKDVLLHFERVRSFFEQAMKVEAVSALPVKIILFRSEKDFKPYRPNEGAAAFYMPGHDADYIVIGPSDRYETIVHEYVHLVVKHSGLKLPAWLNEGFADLYSNMTPVANKVRVGEPLPGRAYELTQQKWIPLEHLFKVDHDSPEYNEKERAGVFYAQSWLLTHMLNLGDEYRPRFRELLQLLVEGKDAPEALQSVYGKSPDRVYKDLQGYLRSQSIKVALFDVKLPKSAGDPQIGQASGFDTGMALANLLAMMRKAEDAEAMYTKLAAEHPDRYEIHEAMGYLAWRMRRTPAAVPLFAKAFDLGSKNPKMLLDYGRMLMSADAKDARIQPVLSRLIEIDPLNVEARMTLAHHYTGLDQFDDGISLLTSIKKATPDQAPSLFRLMAYLYYRLGDQQQALSAAKRFQESARNESEQGDAAQLLAAVDSLGRRRMASIEDSIVARAPIQRMESTAAQVEPGRSLKRIEGRLKELDCMGDKARMHIEAEAGEIVLVIDQPERVVLKQKEGAVELELICGKQTGQSIAAEYEASAGQGAAGLLRVLEVR